MPNRAPPHLPADMLAARAVAGGGIEALEIARVPLPKPEPGEVLVKVAAAGVGPWDVLVRDGGSSVSPKPPLTLGSDLAGIVVDPGDSDFAPGEAVFGATNAGFAGAQAEYAAAEANRIARKPEALSFIEAAAIPVVAVTAHTMLFEYGGLQSGQRVLILGGAGSVGSLAVQFAKRAGAHVVATCHAKDVERVRNLGADEVIDAGAGSFVGAVKAVDLVIDTVGGVAQTASFDILVPGGRLISAVSEPDAALAKARRVETKWFIVDVTRPRLEAVAPLFQDRRIRIVVGEVLPLDQIRLAHEMLAGKPHRPGKIVIALDAA